MITIIIIFVLNGTTSALLNLNLHHTLLSTIVPLHTQMKPNLHPNFSQITLILGTV